MTMRKQAVHIATCRPHQPSESVVFGEQFYKLDDKFIDLRKYDEPSSSWINDSRVQLDAGISGHFVYLRTDPNAHIVYWVNSATMEKEYIDATHIIDVRYGSRAKHLSNKDIEKAYEHFSAQCPALRDQSMLTDCLLTIICGNDFVNLTWLTFVAPSREIAQCFGSDLFALRSNVMTRYATPLSFVRALYAKIRYGCCDASDSEILIRDSSLPDRERAAGPGLLTRRAEGIVKLLARRRDEEGLVERALQACGFTIAHKIGIPVSEFTFDAFLRVYCYLTAREDITKLYNHILKTYHTPLRKSGVASTAPGSSATNKRKILPDIKKRLTNHVRSKASGSGTNGTGTVTDLGPCMTWQQFLGFVKTEQRDPRLNEILYPPHSELSIKKIIRKFEPNPDLLRHHMLSLIGFQRYLHGDDASVLSLDHVDHKAEDMNEPLSHYLVDSSHNSYLPGSSDGEEETVKEHIRRVHIFLSKSFGNDESSTTKHFCLLSGDQYGIPTSRVRASVEIYRLFLVAGCRCLELDIRDPPPGATKAQKGEPIISHGNPLLTSCSYVLFKDVVEAIAECAFKSSEYPLILSFDNACTKPYHDKMASHLKEILGDMLLAEPLEDYPLERGVSLPPPSALKRKILIKNKRMAACSHGNAGNSATPGNTANSGNSIIPSGCEHFLRSTSTGVRPKERTISDTFLCNDQTSNVVVSISQAQQCLPLPQVDALSIASTCTTTSDQDRQCQSQMSTSSSSGIRLSARHGRSTSADHLALERKNSGGESQGSMNSLPGSSSTVRLESIMRQLDMEKVETEVKAEVGQELSMLVNYMTARGRLEGSKLDEYRELNMSCEIYSANHNAAHEVIASPKSGALVAHNKRQMTRVFPSFPTSKKSKNYNPKEYWNAGCQLVALNFQVLDFPMQLNLGVFAQNAGCGYVLKPECMRHRDQYFAPYEATSVANVVPNTLSLQVISSQILCSDTLARSDERFTTAVECSLYGIDADTKTQPKFRVTSVGKPQLGMLYEDRLFEVPKIIFPEMSQIQLVLYDCRSSEPIGQRVLPITGIRPGYRHIMLHNAFNQPLTYVSLFCKISLRDYIPAAQREYVDSFVDPIAWKEQQDYKSNFADVLMNPKKYMNDPLPATFSSNLAGFGDSDDDSTQNSFGGMDDY